jgi:hypothetical protein
VVVPIADELDAVLKSCFYGERAEQIMIALHRAYESADELATANFMGPEAHDVFRSFGALTQNRMLEPN